MVKSSSRLRTHGAGVYHHSMIIIVTRCILVRDCVMSLAGWRATRLDQRGPGGARRERRVHLDVGGSPK